MPPAFPSYILWGGRRGCGERIDVSCWEVNYSNSRLQGAPTIMNPVCLCGVAKAKVASPWKRAPSVLCCPLMLKGSSLPADSVTPRYQRHPGQQQQRLPEAESPQGWAVHVYRARIPQASMCKHPPVLPSTESALLSICCISNGNSKPLLWDYQGTISSKQAAKITSKLQIPDLV